MLNLLQDGLPLRERMLEQWRIFGRGHDAQSNRKFYLWCWANKMHYCEECGRMLPHYNASFVSHILSRGAFPEMAHDPRNVNILCLKCHAQWENGNRQGMKIWPKNEKRIEILKEEYRNFQRI